MKYNMAPVDCEAKKMGENAFSSYYDGAQKLVRAYNEAKNNGDEEGMSDARQERRALTKCIEEEGAIFSFLYDCFEEAKDRENQYLNIKDIIKDNMVAAVVSCLRENGVEKFTYSARSVGAIDTALLFKKAGCELEDVIEINGMVDYWFGGYEIVPAYRFKVN